MPRLLLFAIGLLLTFSAAAQQRLAAARQQSYLTKVFRLTDEQARYLYERSLGAARPAFFTQPVDSFPTAAPEQARALPLGYYLVAHTEGPQLVYWLRAETDREVVVIDNQVDLTLVVRDSLGRPLPAALVALGRRPVPYDAATHAYRLRRPGRPGLVAVTHAGRTTFHPLHQHFPESNRYWSTLSFGRQTARAGRWVLFSSPLRYLTRPVWQLGQDVRHASYVYTGPVGLVRALFSADVREERRERRKNQYDDADPDRPAARGWASYVALSKPRYRPANDTLRFKARVLRRPSGRPCRQPLTLWLGGGYGQPEKRIARLRPLRPGSYQYALPLTDTLGLRVNTRVGFRLATGRGQTLAAGTFELEDYELTSTRYVLRAAEKEHLRGQPQALFLRGTDTNELNLLDARVQLSATPTSVPLPFAQRQVFLPDTLWTRRQALDAVGETRLNLPETTFPAADFRYQVLATFLTSDNERHVATLTIPYRPDPGQLTLALRADSVLLDYKQLGRSTPHRALLTVTNAGPLAADHLFRDSVQLPLVVAVNPRAAAYVLSDAQGRVAQLPLDATNGALSLRSHRTPDSLFLALDNPRRVPFWYFVYRGNTLVYRGYDTAWQLARPAAGPEPWAVSVHYRWGDKLRTAEYTVPRPQGQLLVRTEQPEVAYPGQKIRLTFTVTDGRGRPVPHADLTAYAVTSKFGKTQAPALPSFEPPVTGRVARRQFALARSFENQPAAPAQQLLEWPRWRHQLGLDSLQFYRFLYPEFGTFYQYQPAPGGLTQVAPFVVDSGRVQAPVAVYVDGVPAYVHAVGQLEPYTMVVTPGRHSISIRTARHLVTLHDVHVRHLHKLTLSIDLNQPCAGLTVERRPAQLSAAEKLTLRRSLLVVNNYQGLPGTLRQGNTLHPLHPNAYGPFSLHGPFRPDSVLLRRADGLRRKFLFEPLYLYDFSQDLLKMTSLDSSAFGNLSSAGFAGPLPLDGFAYTEADLRPHPAAAPSRSKAAYRPTPPLPVLDYPRATPAGQGRLEVRLPPPPAAAGPDYVFPRPLYLLLTRPDHPTFRRLVPGGVLLVHALPAGRYRVALLLDDSTCLAPAAAAVVRPDGTTYYQLRLADRQPAGPLGRRILRLVRSYVSPALTTTPVAELERAKRKILVAADRGPRPGWRTVSGQVTDRSTGEGLPGVTVLVKGTTIGCATNADGSYSLQIPADQDTLQFSSIGYVQDERLIRHAVINVGLAADTKQLSEVVVTGLGIARERRSVSGAVATQMRQQLQGQVAGVQISGPTAATTRILIRGASTATGGNPLLMLDGLPFNGRIEDLDPADIASVKLLKSAEATARYGARAANGVLFITTKTSGSAEAAARDPRLALRRNFRDYAWWRPTLVTDARGQATTDITLPDDVTGWDTFVLGSDDHGRMGSASGLLRSFKALLAELAVPRFLIEGDQTQVLGKTLNYRPDTAQVTTRFSVAGQAGPERGHQVITSALDTLTVTAPAGADSLQVSFSLRQANGYADGEQRPIAVLPAGSRERVGTFAILSAADTTLALPFDPALGPVTVRLESDALPVLLSEIAHLQQYAYLCNEQAASKLKALLLEQRIRAYQNQPFKGTKAIHFLIRKLQEGRHQPSGLWGTWARAAVSPWATTHVLEALLAAEQAGYTVSFDRSAVQQYLLQELDHALAAAGVAQPYRAWYYHSADDQIRLLHVLRQLGTATDYATYLARLAQHQTGRQPLDRYLALTELRQQLGLPYQLDTLRRYRLTTQLGGTFYADTLRPGSYFRYLLREEVGATLLAYRLLRTQGGHAAELTRLRSYLLNLRKAGTWRSTYEAAQILETIGPDLLAAGRAATFARVQLSGGLRQEITTFPQQLTVPAAAGPLILRKEGLLPVYATAYQTRWNPAPAATAAPFTVRTALAGQTGGQVRLRAGQPAELVVTVTVAAAARYVLLEVPIPAGCSYGDNRAGNSFEVHREYLRHQTGIFIDQLPVGVHTFRIALQPRYRGRYTLNPARAELMYFPTRFGRSASKQVTVE